MNWYEKKLRAMGMLLAICCLLMSNFSYAMATESDDASTDIADEQNGKIYDGEGEVLRQSLSGERASCTHIPCRRVTDTVWQHRHTGPRCDVYTANATWCKCCNTILKFNSGWVYSYTHYGCNL